MGVMVNEAIQSALRQRCEGTEILLIDDGSEDETWYRLKKCQFHRLRLIRNPTNRGLSYCRNLALNESRGRYLCILDADDILSPNKVRDHWQALEKDPEAGMVWGRTVLLRPGKQGIRRELEPGKDFRAGWDLVTPYLLSHSATTWRKDALIRAGGYDPAKILVEAPDLFLKVGDFAQQIYVPRIACFKRVIPTGKFRAELTEEKRQELSRQILQETLVRRFNYRPQEKDQFGLRSP